MFLMSKRKAKPGGKLALPRKQLFSWNFLQNCHLLHMVGHMNHSTYKVGRMIHMTHHVEHMTILHEITAYSRALYDEV